jgi:two-component system, NtrC family, response regulator GlrR
MNGHATLRVVRGTREISRTRYEIARFRVTVVRGADAPATCESTGVELTIGTEEGNDLRLGDAAVSRHHCVLSVTPHGVELRDLDSTNGTTLAGFRVNSAFVSNGALIGVGETTLRVDLLPDRLASTVSAENRFGPVLGKSLGMRRLFAIAQQVAPSDATILIEGETGTGKGLFAEAIHAASRRAGGPFVVVDCAAMPAQLMESELFGHEAGAFTGASKQRIGLFESAAGGTLLLDEIGELPLELQPKLLRAIERKEIRRIGSTNRISVDVRIMAATNRDLRREVNRGAFRSDLWYRLNTVRLAIPPLRERRDDIALLAHHFYAQMAPDPTAKMPQEMLAKLLLVDWRGNVRELGNAVERMLLSNGDAPLGGDPETDDDDALTFRAAKERATSAWERQYLSRLLTRQHGNVSKAARAARMDRSHLHGLLRRHGLLNAAGEDDDEPTDPG